MLGADESEAHISGDSSGLLADETLAVRRLPPTSTRRTRVVDVLSLAEERDRRQLVTGAIRSGLRKPADRTRRPIRGGSDRGPSGVTLRDLIERKGEGL